MQSPDEHQSETPQNGAPLFESIDRSKFDIVPFGTDDDVEYWLTRPVSERLAAVEFLRSQVIAASGQQRLQRVFEVVEYPQR